MRTIEQWRLRTIHYGLRESRKRFYETLNDKQKQNSFAINASLSELLLWMNVSDEWHYQKNNKEGSFIKKKKEEIGGQYLNGLRFVFNSLKHEMSFIKLITTAGKKQSFIKGNDTEDYSTDSIWLNIDNLIKVKKTHVNNKKIIDERENYKKYLEGKKVIQTVEGAYLFLERLYMKVEEEERERLNRKYNN